MVLPNVGRREGIRAIQAYPLPIQHKTLPPIGLWLIKW